MKNNNLNLKKRKKTRKINKLSVKDYKKIQKALKNYKNEEESDNNTGYAIGVVIFIVLLLWKIIHRATS